ncbi:c-type cytochrome biogenesis protein CcsB [Desulfosoma caldarium]|uniref:Cytochrome c-type biogenesis protein CcsB n=1 Tax=Desulfosoma caldarium TaxID=610254 RepID=A0A3N1UIW4_9BACT|nr:c-type cytochrome biogenesis protein CcsB [Desulfosoma caldarium]ROQ91185.1 cytochrome c-type biogenesis protein CcsB [Desulfosoma caldarium]
MEHILLILAACGYCVGSVGYFFFLVRNGENVHRAAWISLVGGMLFHGAAIGMRFFAAGHLEVSTLSEALSFFSWLLVVTYLVIQNRLGLRILGTFVAPLAAAFTLPSTILPSHMMPASPLLKSVWVWIHVSTLFAANALFAVAFAAAVLYLYQERIIKKKRPGSLDDRLPALERLDRVNHVCLLMGFPLMTLGLLAGFLYASTVWKSPWNWDPKEIFALITWFIYAILLHERLAVGWRGRKAAWLAIFGFSAVLITFLGVNLFLKGHHTLFSSQ